MSIRRIILSIALVLCMCKGQVHAESYYAIIVDSASPAIPIMFKQEIIALPERITLARNYDLVFDRENKPDSKWLLVTPPPNMDRNAEFLADQLKFAWSPLTDGLRLKVHITCVPVSEVFERSPSALSTLNSAFAAHELPSGMVPMLKDVEYDTTRMNRLFKQNAGERLGKAEGKVCVAIVADENGAVQFVTVRSSTNPKLDVSALRTVVCMKFVTPPMPDGKRARYSFPLELTLKK